MTGNLGLGSLQAEIEALFDAKLSSYSEDARQVFQAFVQQLNEGKIRAAEPDETQPTGWRVNTWVKKGILLGFRIGKLTHLPGEGSRQFFDKDTYPLKTFSVSDGVRIVPGGSSIRDGCYVAPGTTCMPPMYINTGSYVDSGTMVDSHALVGSCAQIGRNCHLSAAVQIGGVLEPVGALPVIIEDEVLVGGNCGVYEGTVVGRGAVLGSGTVLNRSTPVYDLVRETVHRASADLPLIIPEEAVVVAGSRRITSGVGKQWKLSVYTPIIVKYRDAGTEAKIQLEDLLR